MVFFFLECLGKHYDWPWMWRDQCGMTMSESMPLIRKYGREPFFSASFTCLLVSCLLNGKPASFIGAPGMPNWESHKTWVPTRKVQNTPVCFIISPKQTPIAGTPSWAEVSVWAPEGQQSHLASCCPCGSGEVWAAGPGAPSVAGWRGCGEAARAGGGCFSRTRCRAAGSCSRGGSARLSCWRRSSAAGRAGVEGRADGRRQAARCPKLQRRCSGSEKRCRCCSCQTARVSWRPDWLTGIQWGKEWKVAWSSFVVIWTWDPGTATERF